MTLWFATGNVHKKAELAAILAGANIANELLIPKDAGLDFDPEETGASFLENALLKARALYSLLNNGVSHPVWRPGDLVIADDSGLCVDALDGRPGIYSARYRGKDTIDKFSRGGAKNAEFGDKLTSAERNALLLEELGDAPHRSARFVCAMALLYSPDRFFAAQETCEGEIVKGQEFAKGTGGFGYDPILYIPELGRTVAELSDDEKNVISHRGKAGKIIAAVLLRG